MSGYGLAELPKKTYAYYFNQQIDIEFDKDENNSMKVGMVLLTSVGHQLISIPNIEPTNVIKQYVIKKWIEEGLKVI